MNNTMVPKYLTIALLSSFMSIGCANNGNNSDQSSSSSTVTENSTELEKVGYSLGYATAESYRETLDDLNLDTFEEGFRDAYGERDAALTKEQMQEIMATYEEKKKAEIIDKMEAEFAAKKEEEDKFFAENANKEGVKTTESGLQYKVLKPGTGQSVTEDDVVKLHYEGKLLDGTVFESSYERNEPVIYPVKGWIPGFSEGLQLMNSGGVYELYIPSNLAYGLAGNEGIEPNSTLIFKVELLDVNPEMPEMAQ